MLCFPAVISDWKSYNLEERVRFNEIRKRMLESAPWMLHQITESTVAIIFRLRNDGYDLQERSYRFFVALKSPDWRGGEERRRFFLRLISSWHRYLLPISSSGDLHSPRNWLKAAWLFNLATMPQLNGGVYDDTRRQFSVGAPECLGHVTRRPHRRIWV